MGDGAAEISGLAYDSRRVGPGTLFFCVPGEKADGHEFAPAAVEAGAAGLVGERQLDKLEVTGSSPVAPTEPGSAPRDLFRSSAGTEHDLRRAGDRCCVTLMAGPPLLEPRPSALQKAR